MTVRVLVVEDEQLAAEAHATYTSRVEGFEVAGVARSAGEAARCCAPGLASERAAQHEEVARQCTHCSLHGIVGRHEWGTRATAYEVRKHAEADYHLLQFRGPRELLEQLDHNLKITDGILRHRIIKLRPGTAPPPDLSAAARASCRRGASRGCGNPTMQKFSP